MGKYFQRYYKAFPLQKRKRLCLRGSATVCSPALNCPSRCTEMETSYSVQLPAQSSIVLLASNVTRLGSQCETDHCAHWRRLQLWVKRTDDWTQTAALNCHCFQEMEPLTVMWLIEKLLSFLSFQLVSPISKSPRGPLQSRHFSFARHTAVRPKHVTVHQLTVVFCSRVTPCSCDSVSLVNLFESPL